MGFCPKCKMEYQDGIVECADCHVKLVEQLLNPNYVPLLSLKSAAVAEKFCKYLEYSHITVDSETACDNKIILTGLPKTETKLRSSWNTFVLMEIGGELQNDLLEEDEAFDILHTAIPKQLQKSITDAAIRQESSIPVGEKNEEDNDEAAQNLFRAPGGNYESMEKKAEDSYGSAILLISFGLLGSIYTLLNIFKIFNHFQGPFSLGLLLVFFLVLFVMGIYTWKQYHVYRTQAAEEADFKEVIFQWLTANITKECLPGNPEEYPQEELDLIRMNWISQELINSFPNLSADAAGEYSEEFYDSL